PQARTRSGPSRRRLRVRRRRDRHRLMQHVSGFAPLCPRYDGFILDLWGVLHDGVTAYPGVVAHPPCGEFPLDTVTAESIHEHG
ncbi:MAG: hypothetical protein ACREP1_02325, partial [Rhodanobacteraceae bacterium]